MRTPDLVRELSRLTSSSDSGTGSLPHKNDKCLVEALLLNFL